MVLKKQYIFQYSLEHQRLISLFLHHQFSNFAIQAQPTSVPWEAYISARELTTISKSEFRRIKVDLLKKYLTDCGIPSTGKKDELLGLAVTAQRKYKVLEVCDHLNSEIPVVSISFGGTMPKKLISYLQFIPDVWSTSMEDPVMPGLWWHNSKTASYSPV